MPSADKLRRTRLAHLRLGATGAAPRWRRAGETGHQEKGDIWRSVRLPWLSELSVAVCYLKEKKIYAQMDFQGCRGDKKWGRVTCPSAMIKTVGRESRDCVHGHGCESGVTQVMHGDIYSILSD